VHSPSSETRRSSPSGLAAKVIHIVPALIVVERDDGGAATKPAERLAEWNVKIERKAAVGPVVFRNFSHFDHDSPG
jgi:hypothetical protein